MVANWDGEIVRIPVDTMRVIEIVKKCLDHEVWSVEFGGGWQDTRIMDRTREYCETYILQTSTTGGAFLHLQAECNFDHELPATARTATCEITLFGVSGDDHRRMFRCDVDEDGNVTALPQQNPQDKSGSTGGA